MLEAHVKETNYKIKPENYYCYPYFNTILCITVWNPCASSSFISDFFIMFIYIYAYNVIRRMKQEKVLLSIDNHRPVLFILMLII